VKVIPSVKRGKDTKSVILVPVTESPPPVDDPDISLPI